MKVLSTLDSNARQSLYFITDDRKRLKFTFYFLPTQSNWYFDVESDEFNLYGQRLCAHPNLLTKYHNIIDFGLQVNTNDGLDPFQITDFVTGYCQIGVLNADEVSTIERYLNNET